MEGDLLKRRVHYDQEPLPDGTRVDIVGVVDDTGLIPNPDGSYQIVRTEPMSDPPTWWYLVTLRRIATD